MVSWQTVLVFLIVVLLLFWIFLGDSNANYEVVGLKQLMDPASPMDYCTIPMPPPRITNTAKICFARPEKTEKQYTWKENRPFRSTGEKLCCKVLEDYLQREVQVNVTPDFLLDRKLSLDVYDADMGFAIEYNGEQHYTFPNNWHKSREEFERQIENDRIKKALCEANNVNLIIVPFTVDSVTDRGVYRNFPETSREKRIRNELVPILEEYYNCAELQT